MASAASRQQVLGLYRRLLRLHRQRLPSSVRLLGDAYVKSEFRQHRDAKPDFVAGFIAEWENYAEQLLSQQVAAGTLAAEGSASARLGADLDTDTMQQMTEEQQVQLHRLRAEAERAGRELEK